ncbi:hypothetical protein KIW84_075116 [Lathyrus oleraceus]|uniref:Aminotransferase-like plant mobile domain-containing protein n=1 Tax=Pisum sativum TaxID=3888 RepID=A0A9D4VU43_PEA|nr:hypothetical protein KIW84_075116 [Pisum sativum]
MQQNQPHLQPVDNNLEDPTDPRLLTRGIWSKAPKKISEVPPFATLSATLAVDNRQYLPEPQTEEQRQIYASQVLIPVSVSNKTYALFGPLADLDTDTNKLREFFPSYHKCKPIGQAKNPRTSSSENTPAENAINLRFMNNGFRAFRATPTFKDPTDYSNWLNKIEKQKSQAWKDIGIYDLIMLSKLNHDYSNPMLVSSLYFWDSTHYTFHLPYGMISLPFSTTRAAYSTHISHYHDKDTETVSDVEHIAFLDLWQSHSVFCSKSLQVAKKYLTLANQLHAGHDVCLSEMIFTSLYESLSDEVVQLKNFGDKGNLLLIGPFWLLQLWLNATFEANLPNKGLIDEDIEEIKHMRVEGPRLAQLTPRDEGQALQSTFMSYIMMFAKSHNFTSSMTPFALRKVGPICREFGKWWAKYYIEEFCDVTSFIQLFDKAFLLMQESTKKGTYTLIKEIQVFQNYFETAYRPDDLSRTIRETTVMLKEKFSKKIETLKIPSYVPCEKRYEMALKLFPPKFPPLPNVDFRKKAQRVVATKHTLGSFKGHLHIGIEDVRIESDICEAIRIHPKKHTNKRPIDSKVEGSSKPAKVARKPPMSPLQIQKPTATSIVVDSDEDDLSPVLDLTSRKRKP